MELSSVITYPQFLNLIFHFMISSECLPMKHTNLYLRRFLLICFYFVFVLDPTREMSKLLAVIVLTFSVRRPRIL